MASGDGPVRVGFSAETEDVVSHASAKRAAKHVDLIVANVEGDAQAAAQALAGLDQVDRVEVNGGEVTIAVADGPTALSPVEARAFSLEVVWPRDGEPQATLFSGTIDPPYRLGPLGLDPNSGCR